MRRLVLCLTVTAAFAAPVALSLAQGDGGGLAQNVIVDNSAGGTVLARFALEAARTQGSGSPTNFARANSHDCATPCQSLAAAFQIVLVPKGLTTQAPENVALATNVNCTGCGAFAYAYQYVVEVARDVTLSGHARHLIGALRREADQDVHAGLDYPTLDSKLHDLATRFRAVVDNDLAQQHVRETHKQSFQDVKERPAA